ncbi:MAG: AMP-binding protein [Peptococcaceae bacterium]|jgi:acetyl-CoA synthetase/medium-chain acyl-CoA synthetase|nr:AMP-binding protein [Peptococcaceae bacterium]
MPNMTDYDATYASFQWDVPEDFNFARDTFDRWAADPDKLALWWVDEAGREEKRTFGQLKEESERLCHVFRSQGVGRGDVVVVVLPRLIEWWVVNLACLRAGIVVSPGTTQLTPKDMQFRCQTADAVGVLTDNANAAKVDEIKAACPTLKSFIVVGEDRPGWTTYAGAVAGAPAGMPAENTKSTDPAILYFTSGTTGYPKMTLHTQASYPIGHYVTGHFWLDLTPDDLHWNLSDTGWAKAAWSSFFAPWICGAAVFVQHAARFDPATTLELLQKYPVTTLCGAPTNYRMMVLQDLAAYKFPRLRHCVGAGEPLNPEVIETWRQHTGLTIRDGYGQTETVLICGNFPPIELRYGSMGKPSPGIDLQVIDEEGTIVPPNTEGDVAIRVRPVRPAGLFREYWKDPEKTAASYRGDWYVTGDRAYRDPEGYFWFVGRADDVILTSGYRIGPFEVESALIEHPAVAESAVVSSPDELRGEVVKAFVILAPGYQASEDLARELQEHVKKVTAPYKYPRKIEFVTTLPKTISGKIRRIELRQAEWAGWKK